MTPSNGEDLVRRGEALWNEIREQADEGVDCPCCGRLVKRYRRIMHAEMGAFLCRLYVADRYLPGGAFHVRNLNPATAKASTDASYLAYWGLLERCPLAGFYRITPQGRQFVERLRLVFSHVVLLCGEFEGLEGELVDIDKVLGTHFDRDELLAKTPLTTTANDRERYAETW
jgi:hypothetical protein